MDKKTNDWSMDTNSLNIKFMHVIKRFDKNLEKEYYDDFFIHSLVFVRLTLVMTCILYAAFGILDTWIVPLSKEWTWIIRYAIVCPITVIYFIFTFTPLFKKIMQAALSLFALITGFGIVIMIGIAQPSEPGFQFYYAGLMLVIMASFTLIRLRFIYATITCWIIILGYEYVAVFFQGMLSIPEQIPIFLNNNFFFISANIIGMLSSFLIEYFIRNDFLLRKKLWIEEEKERQKTARELARTKQELNHAHSTLQSMELETDTGLQSISNTIKNKHAVQQEMNKKLAQKMLQLKHAARQLGDKAPKAITKSIALVLDRFEQNVLAELGKNRSHEPAIAHSITLHTMKKKIINGFEAQNLESIERFISKQIKDYTGEAAGALEEVFNNMNNIIAYTHAILAYQRGQEIAIEEHVNSALQRVYYNIQNTYKKELAAYKIEFAYENYTDSLVVLRVYDFILEEDIIRNLFLNSFRALVESDPDNTRADKKIWIEVYEERIKGHGEFYTIHFKDNGPGIPADKKQAIFEGYSTKTFTDNRRETDAAERGIGCRTVIKRIKEIAGTVVQEGTPGQGADFVIKIPKHAKIAAITLSLDSVAGEPVVPAE